MTEQTNPNPEMEANGVAPALSQPPVSRPVPVERAAEDFVEDEDNGVDEEEEGYSGPEEYVEREKGTRGRRVGSDIRLDDIDYKNVPLLSRFLDRRGRILSRRKTRVSAKVQRRIVREVKRARHMALVPYTADQTRIVRRRK